MNKNPTGEKNGKNAIMLVGFISQKYDRREFGIASLFLVSYIDPKML
jgi:hypothetical protein